MNPVRLVVADHLRGCGFDVVEANNADEAMRVLEAGIASGRRSSSS